MRYVPHGAGGILAKLFFQHVLPKPLARTDLPAIAPRSTKANALGLQHDDIIAAFAQMQRRRKPGIAGADNADIGAGLTPQRGLLRQKISRGCVI